MGRGDFYRNTEKNRPEFGHDDLECAGWQRTALNTYNNLSIINNSQYFVKIIKKLFNIP
jgi:hypothetical protein